MKPPASLALTRASGWLLAAALTVVPACEVDDTTTDASDTAGDTTATDATTSDTASDTADTAADTTGPDGCGAPGGASPRFDQPASVFRARVYDTYRSVDGAVFVGAQLTPHNEAERQGACRLLRYTPSTCTPECDFGQPCIAGECRSYLEATPIGTLTLTGIASAPVVVEPNEVGTYYWGADGSFAVAAITLAATGGTLGALSLTACAPPELAPIGDWSALLEARADGADVTLTWSDPAPGARVYMRMTTGIGTHGGISPVEVECEGPDTGTLTLPGAFLDALYERGAWSCGECGGNDLFRYYADEVTAGGTAIQLRASTSASFWYRP